MGFVIPIISVVLQVLATEAFLSQDPEAQAAKAVNSTVAEAASESSDVDDIAQQMMMDLLGDVTLEAEPSADEVEFS